MSTNGADANNLKSKKKSPIERTITEFQVPNITCRVRRSEVIEKAPIIFSCTFPFTTKNARDLRNEFKKRRINIPVLQPSILHGESKKKETVSPELQPINDENDDYPEHLKDILTIPFTLEFSSHLEEISDVFSPNLTFSWPLPNQQNKNQIAIQDLEMNSKNKSKAVSLKKN